MSSALPRVDEPAFRDPALPIADRVADLVARLSVPEKIAMLHQHQPAVPRLGIAEFHTGMEALHGVAWSGRATVFPQAIGLGSTWNTDLVRAVGDAVGIEVRGFHARDPVRYSLNVWAPVVNPLRDPRWGRNEEGYAEDPLLTARMATAYASGLRGTDPTRLRTAPTLKHFLGYNNETNRCITSSGLRQRVLHEYELPCYLGPLAAGAAVAVMPSYNLVNGRPAHLSTLIEETLRTAGAPEVAVLSDAHAPSNIAGMQAFHATQAEGHAAALHAGLDSFTDQGLDAELTVTAVTEALRTGLIDVAVIDRAVGRLLSLRARLGEFDGPGDGPYDGITEDVIDCAEHRTLALEAARQSIVLLKHDHGLLPLDPTSGGSIAVIGSHAAMLFEDWYSGTLPYQVTPLDGIGARNAGPTTFVEGVDRIALRAPDGRLLSVAGGGPGIELSTGEPSPAQLFDRFDWGPGLSDDGTETTEISTLRNVASRRWLASTADGGVIADATMPGGWDVHELFELRPVGAEVLLRNMVLDKFLATSDDLAWVDDAAAATPFHVDVVATGLDAAVAAAAGSDVAVVVIGNDPHINGRETQDRADLDLPPAQYRLVREVAAANPRTVLVLVSSYPYALGELAEAVPAILWTAHGGQDEGTALAEVLFGATNPAGRLTQTWYRAADQLPDLGDYDIMKAGSTYLWFAGEPLYPFGHGLSYTTFTHDQLVCDVDELDAAGTAAVSVRVTNTGDRRGAEVVQLYHRQLRSRNPQPLRRLLGFARVELDPGGSTTVHFPLTGDDLAHWDVTRGRRVVESATHELMVGASASAITCRTELAVRGETVPPTALRDRVLRAEAFDDYESVALVVETPAAGTAVEGSASGAWIAFHDVDVDAAIDTAAVDLASGGVELRIDDPVNGAVLATAAVDPRLPTGEWQRVRVPIAPSGGRHPLYVVCTEPGTRLAALRFLVTARDEG